MSGKQPHEVTTIELIVQNLMSSTPITHIVSEVYDSIFSELLNYDQEFDTTLDNTNFFLSQIWIEFPGRNYMSTLQKCYEIAPNEVYIHLIVIMMNQLNKMLNNTNNLPVNHTIILVMCRASRYNKNIDPDFNVCFHLFQLLTHELFLHQNLAVKHVWEAVRDMVADATKVGCNIIPFLMKPKSDYSIPNNMDHFFESLFACLTTKELIADFIKLYKGIFVTIPNEQRLTFLTRTESLIYGFITRYPSEYEKCLLSFDDPIAYDTFQELSNTYSIQAHQTWPVMMFFLSFSMASIGANDLISILTQIAFILDVSSKRKDSNHYSPIQCSISSVFILLSARRILIERFPQDIDSLVEASVGMIYNQLEKDYSYEQYLAHKGGYMAYELEYKKDEKYQYFQSFFSDNCSLQRSIIFSRSSTIFFTCSALNEEISDMIIEHLFNLIHNAMKSKSQENYRVITHAIDPIIAGQSLKTVLELSSDDQLLSEIMECNNVIKSMIKTLLKDDKLKDFVSAALQMISEKLDKCSPKLFSLLMNIFLPYTEWKNKKINFDDVASILQNFHDIIFSLLINKQQSNIGKILSIYFNMANWILLIIRMRITSIEYHPYILSFCQQIKGTTLIIRAFFDDRFKIWENKCLLCVSKMCSYISAPHVPITEPVLDQILSIPFVLHRNFRSVTTSLLLAYSLLNEQLMSTKSNEFIYKLLTEIVGDTSMIASLNDIDEESISIFFVSILQYVEPIIDNFDFPPLPNVIHIIKCSQKLVGCIKGESESLGLAAKLGYLFVKLLHMLPYQDKQFIIEVSHLIESLYHFDMILHYTYTRMTFRLLCEFIFFETFEAKETIIIESLLKALVAINSCIDIMDSVVFKKKTLFDIFKRVSKTTQQVLNVIEGCFIKYKLLSSQLIQESVRTLVKNNFFLTFNVLLQRKGEAINPFLISAESNILTPQQIYDNEVHFEEEKMIAPHFILEFEFLLQIDSLVVFEIINTFVFSVRYEKKLLDYMLDHSAPNKYYTAYIKKSIRKQNVENMFDCFLKNDIDGFISSISGFSSSLVYLIEKLDDIMSFVDYFIRPFLYEPVFFGINATTEKKQVDDFILSLLENESFESRIRKEKPMKKSNKPCTIESYDKMIDIFGSPAGIIDELDTFQHPCVDISAILPEDLLKLRDSNCLMHAAPVTANQEVWGFISKRFVELQNIGIQTLAKFILLHFYDSNTGMYSNKKIIFIADMSHFGSQEPGKINEFFDYFPNEFIDNVDTIYITNSFIGFYIEQVNENIRDKIKIAESIQVVVNEIPDIYQAITSYMQPSINNFIFNITWGKEKAKLRFHRTRLSIVVLNSNNEGRSLYSLSWKYRDISNVAWNQHGFSFVDNNSGNTNNVITKNGKEISTALRIKTSYAGNLYDLISLVPLSEPQILSHSLSNIKNSDFITQKAALSIFNRITLSSSDEIDISRGFVPNLKNIAEQFMNYPHYQETLSYFTYKISIMKIREFSSFLAPIFDKFEDIEKYMFIAKIPSVYNRMENENHLNLIKQNITNIFEKNGTKKEMFIHDFVEILQQELSEQSFTKLRSILYLISSSDDSYIKYYNAVSNLDPTNDYLTILQIIFDFIKDFGIFEEVAKAFQNESSPFSLLVRCKICENPPEISNIIYKNISVGAGLRYCLASLNTIKEKIEDKTSLFVMASFLLKFSNEIGQEIISFCLNDPNIFSKSKALLSDEPNPALFLMKCFVRHDMYNLISDAKEKQDLSNEDKCSFDLYQALSNANISIEKIIEGTKTPFQSLEFIGYLMMKSKMLERKEEIIDLLLSVISNEEDDDTLKKLTELFNHINYGNSIKDEQEDEIALNKAKVLASSMNC